MQEKKSVFERNPIKTSLVIIFISYLIIDVSLAYFSKYIENTVIENSGVQHDKINTLHPVYHHGFKENAYTELHHPLLNLKWAQYTNSLGFKDKSNREIKLIPNNHRVVFIGDSITEGIGYEFENTFVGLISNILEQKEIEVLNASRVSYSPIIYWRKVKYLIENIGLDFDELIVLIDISDIQDEAEVYELDEELNVKWKRKSEEYLRAREIVNYGDGLLPYTDNLNLQNFINNTREFITEHTFITYHALNLVYDKLLNEKRLPYTYLNPDYTRLSWPYYKKAYDEYAEIGISNSITYMDLLLELLKKHDIKLTLGVYPIPTNIYYDKKDSIHVKIWDDWTKKNEIDFFNLFPRLVNEKITAKEKLEIIDEYYIKHDMHFNAIGHEMFAKEFLKFFKIE